MARLVGVDLPRNKRLEVALTYIYGIGPARATSNLLLRGKSTPTNLAMFFFPLFLLYFTTN